MAFPLERTLVDVRRAVAIRSGMAQSGHLPNRMQAIMDETINECQRTIYMRAQWARLAQSREITLVTGQANYDIPDDFPIGMISRITVKNTDGREYLVGYDDVVDLQSLTLTGNSKPMYWRMLNEVIVLTPPPDATVYPTLRIEGDIGPKWLVNEQDRLCVDSEAVVQLATIKFKEYLGIGGDQERARVDFQQYLYDLRSQVSPNRSIPIASRWADGPAYWRWPSVDTYTLPWANGNWGPPGGGW